MDRKGFAPIVILLVLAAGVLAIGRIYISLRQSGTHPPPVAPVSTSGVTAKNTTPLNPSSTARSLHSKNSNSPISWEEGDFTFTLISVSIGQSAGLSAIDIGLKIKNNNASNTLTAPLDLRLVSGEYGNEGAPYELDFSGGRTGGATLGPNGIATGDVYFHISGNGNTFLFSAGQPSGVFFEVKRIPAHGGTWLIVQEKAASENDCTPVFLSGNFGTSLSLREECPVCVVTSPTSTKKTNSPCPEYPQSCAISDDIPVYFKSAFVAASVKNTGSAPKEGFSYQTLSHSLQAKQTEPGFVARGFTACDFQNVETLGGHYEVSRAEVIFTKDPKSSASSSAQEVISDAGYKTLFSNIVWRLGSQNDCLPKVSWSKSCIDKIVPGQLDNQAILEDYIRQERWTSFHNEMSQANYCEVTADCVQMNDSCLYPCGGPLVNKNEVNHIRQLLTDQKKSHPGQCSMADCVWSPDNPGPPAPACINHSCGYPR